MGSIVTWPKHKLPGTPEMRAKALEAVTQAFAPTVESLDVDLGLNELFEQIYVPVACSILDRLTPGTPLVVGINGAQGAGKATLYNLLEVILTEGFGLKVTGFSIDDLYLTRAERDALAQSVHPLLKTRGVPGTHDVELGKALLSRLKQAGPDDLTRIPIFDKSTDERVPEQMWHEWHGSADVIIFDGWCVGGIAEPDEALLSPINELENLEDPEGVWRHYVNQKLATSYQELFGFLDMLVMLKVPDMQAVYDWRTVQEQKLKDRASLLYDERAPSDPLRIMDGTEITRFIAHYERLTRWMLDEIPTRADITLALNANHKIERIILP